MGIGLKIAGAFRAYQHTVYSITLVERSGLVPRPTDGTVALMFNIELHC